MYSSYFSQLSSPFISKQNSNLVHLLVTGKVLTAFGFKLSLTYKVYAGWQNMLDFAQM